MAERDNWQRRYRMVCAPEGRHVVADEPELLLDVLIDGYLKIPEQLRYLARIGHAGNVRRRLQQRILSAYGPSGLTPDEERAFLDDPVPMQIPPSWSADVPLILVDGHYVDGPKPERAAGQTVWLETGDEDGYLRSLATAGEILLTIWQDATDSADAALPAAGV